MATTVQSRKAKGRNLQKEVVKKILETFTDLTERDVQSTSMGASGVDVKLSQAAAERFPYAIECKNVEKINIWSAIEQAEANKNELEPLLVFKRNRSKTYCVINFETFMKLVGD